MQCFVVMVTDISLLKHMQFVGYTQSTGYATAKNATAALSKPLVKQSQHIPSSPSTLSQLLAYQYVPTLSIAIYLQFVLT